MRDEDEELGLMEGVSFRRRRKRGEGGLAKNATINIQAVNVMHL